KPSTQLTTVSERNGRNGKEKSSNCVSWKSASSSGSTAVGRSAAEAVTRSDGTKDAAYRSRASPIAAASASSRRQCSLPVWSTSCSPTVGRPSAIPQAMPTRRSSPGAASRSWTPLTIPVSGDTNVLRRGRTAAGGARARRRSVTGKRGLLIPGKRLCDVAESRARGAARHPVHVVDADAKLGRQLDRVERGRHVRIPEHDPLERQRSGDPGDDRGHRRSGWIGRRGLLEERELVGAVQIRRATAPKALEAARLVREVERPDRRVPAVERKHLEPRLALCQGLGVPVLERRQLRGRRGADREVESGDDRLRPLDEQAALPEQATDFGCERAAADNRHRRTPE